MDRYPFEDFLEKPFKYKSKKRMTGLGKENARICLLYIYLNSWNSQAVANKITATGIWRGSVALVMVTYFFTLPTVILCLYLGKFLKHGSLSLYKCCPLLCGVGILSYLLAFPLGAMMVYYPLSENLFMAWLLRFHAELPVCKELKRILKLPDYNVCIEDKGDYECCSHHGVTATGATNNVDCIQPRYSFYLLYIDVGEMCSYVSSIFKIKCDYWLVFFFVCMIVVMIDIREFHHILVYTDKFSNWMLMAITLCSLAHMEVVFTGLWYYYKDFRPQEELLTTFYDLVIMEVDNLSITLPFLLMIGRLIDDGVAIDELSISLAISKLKKQFWQSNGYIAVISVVATRYGVEYQCLHNVRKPTLITLAVIPEFFHLTYVRAVKYPVMIAYFLSIFLKKVSSLFLFGNLLTYHLYMWERREGKTDVEKRRARRYNIKRKFIQSMVKMLVYILLNICQRIFNLKVPMIPAMMIASTIVLAIQLLFFSFMILQIYSVKRFKVDVEAVTKKKLWPELLTQLKFHPFFCLVFTVMRLVQFYFFMDISIESISAREAWVVPMKPFYAFYPLFYIGPALLISFFYISLQCMIRFEFNIFKVSDDWGPVNKEKWKRIRPFHPGRNMIFYDKLSFDHHICFINHRRISHVSNEQIQNIDLFARKWPCILETNKYKSYKYEIDELITEAYKWGILASFETS